MFKPFVKNKFVNYYENFMSEAIEFAKASNADKSYIWFTDDKNDIKRVFGENQTLSTGPPVTKDKTINVDQSTKIGDKDPYDVSLSVLRDVLLSKLPEDKSKAKDMLRSTVDCIERELEIKADRLKKSDDMLRFSDLRLKSQVPSDNLNVKIEDLIEQIRKEGENIKLKLADAVDKQNSTDTIEHIFSTQLVDYQQRYTSQLDLTEQTLHKELESVKDDIEGMARSIEVSEGHRFKTTSQDLATRAHNLEKVEDTIAHHENLNESTVTHRVDNRKPVDTLPVIVETKEEAKTGTDNKSTNDEAIRFESEFTNQLDSAKLQNDEAHKSVSERRSQVKANDIITGNNEKQLTTILDAQHTINTDVSKEIETTKKSLTQIRDRLNKNIISTEKYLAEIKTKHAKFNEVLLLKQKNHEDLEMQYNNIQFEIGNQIEKQQQLERKESDIDTTINISEMKEQDLSTQKEKIQATLNEEAIKQQLIVEQQSELNRSIENLTDYKDELKEKKLNIEQTVSEQYDKQHDIEKEIIKVNSKIQEEAVKRKELELEKEVIENQLVSEKTLEEQLLSQKNTLQNEIGVDKLTLETVSGNDKQHLKEHVKLLEEAAKEVDAKIGVHKNAEKHLEEEKKNVTDKIEKEERILEDEVAKKEELIAKNLRISERIKANETEMNQLAEYMKESSVKITDLKVQKLNFDDKLRQIEQTCEKFEEDKTQLESQLSAEGGNKKSLKEKKKKLAKKIKDAEDQKSKLLEDSEKIAELLDQETQSESGLALRQKELDETRLTLEKEQANLLIEKSFVDRNLERMDTNKL